ncbi:ABC-2 type transport system ATP-binding protein [Friedmanniella luteola]|uniref:ABC-2 type transport system ATP-binding protein n=1 Tax=Friedmanniella luteola TaxID=546871 RepID=A0A1H1ZQE6_9ACTN|nr:ABC transporter ATP-binding protein [Friedmanniella luteola]SDT35870.1 ABC-2 type transport system ATP-binding protein [Friedmanniella luteola]
MAVIEAQQVTKRYPRVTALDGLDLTVGDGVTGLVGANGAGKSTLIKILLGLLPLTSGRARVFGHDVATDGATIRALVGYMPEHECLPADVSANDFVVHMGEMSGLPHPAARERAADVLRQVGLAEERYRPMGGYSTGMKQRAKLAQALVHDPRLVLLDEPTNGLDPRSRDDMLALVRKIGTEFGIAVLVTSHLLGELERVSDHVVVLDAGRLLRSSATTDYLHTTGTLLVEVLGGRRETEQLVQALVGAGVVAAVAGTMVEVEAADSSAHDTVRDLTVELGLGLVRMQERHHHIEDVFRDEEAGRVQPV